MRTALSAPETATGPMGPLLFLSLAMHLGAAGGGQQCGLPRPLPAGQLARDRPVTVFHVASVGVRWAG